MAHESSMSAEWTVTAYTADATIKAGDGSLYSVWVSMDGVTAGDSAVLKSNGTAIWTLMAGSTDHNESFVFGGVGFHNLTLDITDNGAIYVTVCYR